MEQRDIAQGIGPQCEVHRCRPWSSGVQQLLAPALREVVDAALGGAILEMSVNAGKGKLLLSVVACLLERVV